MPDDLDPDDLPVPRTSAEVTPRNLERLRAQTDALGYMLADDVCALAAVKYTTLEAWAKRGEGPAYVMLGNRRLYPVEGMRDFLRGRVKTRASNAGRIL